MLHIAICDDDRILLEDLRREVESWAKEEHEACSVELFATAEAFWFAWEEKKNIEILLLDIEMPGMSGMELAKMLHRSGKHIGIIFVTGNPDYALEGYDLEAVSYLVKPVDRERLSMALRRGGQRARNRAALLVPVSAGEVERVYVSDMVFLEGNGHDTILRKRDGTCIVAKITLQQLEQGLQAKSESFFKPHRSYYINLSYVERITKKDVQMEGGTLVPIARGKWEALNRAYMEHFRRYF